MAAGPFKGMEALDGAENHCQIATLLVRYYVGLRTTSVVTRTDLEIPPSFSSITASVVSCITTRCRIRTSILDAWLLNDFRDIRVGDYLIQAFDKPHGEQKSPETKRIAKCIGTAFGLNSSRNIEHLLHQVAGICESTNDSTHRWADYPAMSSLHTVLYHSHSTS